VLLGLAEIELEFRAERQAAGIICGLMGAPSIKS
jgi:hypothetical protein